MSTRPKPRPRPKPVARTSESSANASSSGAIPQIPKDVDDDSLFMRNTTRTNNTWTKLNALTNDKKKKKRNSESGSEADSTDSGSSPQARKHKRKKAASSAIWKNEKNLERLLSTGLSSDEEDSDVQEVENLSPSSKLKRKRRVDVDREQKSRSRSLTPPPDIPLHQLQNASNIIRQALGTVPRPASPNSEEADESNDTIILDPELANIAREIRSQSRPSILSNDDREDKVTFQVKWQPHPLNAYAKDDVWAFKMNRTDNFRDLFEAVADEAAIMAANLIMTYNGKRFFPSVTPNTLQIWGQAEFVACDKATFEYLRQQSRQTQQQTPTSPSCDKNAPIEIDADSDSADEQGPLRQQTDAPSDVESQVDDKFKLTLRSALTKDRDIVLTVRPTTKCGAIVKAFLKKAGLADKYPDAGGTAKSPVKKGKKNAGTIGADPRLNIDGDKVANDMEIGEMDLEDGDLVEVVGL